MQEAKEIFLLGYSGHAFVVVEAALMQGMRISGYAEKSPVAFNPFDLAYIGDEALPDFPGWTKGAKFLLGIGDNKIRSKVAAIVVEKGYECLSLIHPDAKASPYSTIGAGTFIARNAAVNPICKIGNNVIINTSSSVDHECTIEDCAHIAPGAVLAGNVKVGQGAFIGADAVIIQGVSVGKGAVVGAGAVVLNDIPDYQMWVGNPAKSLDK